MKKLFILSILFFLICSFNVFASEKTYTLHKLGTVITGSNYKFSLNSVRWDNGDEFSEPDSGKKWFVADCTIQNTGNDSFGVSSMLMLILYDDEGYSQSQTIFANTKGAFDGMVAPSQTMRGEVAFEVDADCSYWEFTFKPDIFNPNQYFYSIVKEQIK